MTRDQIRGNKKPNDLEIKTGEYQYPTCSFGWWLVAGAGLF
jgi:hypothetical protein